jgi:fucose permease
MRDRNAWLTIRFCYLGSFVQAIVINLAPVLFIPLREQFGLTYEQIGRLILINFTTQVTTDLVFGYIVDRTGPKPFVVAANVLAAAGLWLFALTPAAFPDPYTGLVLGTLVFSLGSGLLELLLSPILNALPSDQKAADMSLMHSFYAWGSATVILLTTVALFVVGSEHWRGITLLWSILPLVAAFGFARLRIPRFVEEHARQRLRNLIRIPDFLVAVVAIGLAGASELSIAQWTSAFAEKGLGLPKIVGDVAGLVLFAVALGLGRVWFGVKGEKVDLYKPMIAGAMLATVVYLVATLSPLPGLSLAACVLAGLGVSLLWPGMLSIAAARFPLAGASMFALMSASGDVGGAVAPWLVGVIADRAPFLMQLSGSILPANLTAEEAGLRSGLFFATLYPALMVVMLLILRAGARRRAVAAQEAAA